LVQVYRDNDDLRLILPDDDPDYSWNVISERFCSPNFW
jgi:hypothetical protein